MLAGNAAGDAGGGCDGRLQCGGQRDTAQRRTRNVDGRTGRTGRTEGRASEQVDVLLQLYLLPLGQLVELVRRHSEHLLATDTATSPTLTQHSLQLGEAGVRRRTTPFGKATTPVRHVFLLRF